MRRLGIHQNIPVSVTKLTLGLRVGFIGSHLTVDKLIPVNPSYDVNLNIKWLNFILDFDAYVF